MPKDGEGEEPSEAEEVLEDADEDELLDEDTNTGRSSGRRVMRFARRLMDRRDLAEDTKDLLYTVISTSDKAKTEAVKMVAREVRSYLAELKLKEDLMELARSHSLEISISLKPLVPEGPDAPIDEDPPPESADDVEDAPAG